MLKPLVAGVVVAVMLEGAAVAESPYVAGVKAYHRCDFDQAVMLLREAAQQGSKDAQYFLGEMYEEGRFVPQSNLEALKWYSMAVAQGFPPALERLGADGTVTLAPHHRPGAEETDPDIKAAQERAVIELRPLAEQGDADAQEKLGYMYSLGGGVPQDTIEATNWWLRAAEQGNATAQWELGLTYSCGEVSAPRNYGKAVKWFRLASEQGLPVAQNSLGEMYRDGNGVPKDYVLAYMWFNLAAAKGNIPSEIYRDNLARLMTRDQIAEAQRLARQWKPSR